jgi:hypothetical protein
MIYAALLQDPMLALEATALVMTSVFMGHLAIADKAQDRVEENRQNSKNRISNRLETMFDVGKAVFIPKHYLSGQRVVSR